MKEPVRINVSLKLSPTEIILRRTAMRKLRRKLRQRASNLAGRPKKNP